MVICLSTWDAIPLPPRIPACPPLTSTSNCRRTLPQHTLFVEGSETICAAAPAAALTALVLALDGRAVASVPIGTGVSHVGTNL